MLEPIKTALNGQFTDAHAHPSLEQLKSWKKEGYTDIVLFGRFQPFHRGHEDLLETLRASDLNVNLVLNDKVDGAEGERNPFNPHQREHMAKLALPWLSDDNIRHANVYLGGGGDVGDGIRRLTNIFNTLAPQGKLVFAYFEKAEDRKKYLVDGQIIENAHYVELVGQPRGEFPIQRITGDMIEAVTGRPRLEIDAKMFRNASEGDKNEVRYKYLRPAVGDYLKEQYALAQANGRLVGADPANDEYTLDDLRNHQGFEQPLISAAMGG